MKIDNRRQWWSRVLKDRLHGRSRKHGFGDGAKWYFLLPDSQWPPCAEESDPAHSEKSDSSDSSVKSSGFCEESDSSTNGLFDELDPSTSPTPTAPEESNSPKSPVFPKPDSSQKQQDFVEEYEEYEESTCAEMDSSATDDPTLDPDFDPQGHGDAELATCDVESDAGETSVSPASKETSEVESDSPAQGCAPASKETPEAEIDSPAPYGAGESKETPEVETDAGGTGVPPASKETSEVNEEPDYCPDGNLRQGVTVGVDPATGAVGAKSRQGDFFFELPTFPVRDPADDNFGDGSQWS